MSKTWKWILGITLGLVILFGVGYAAAYFFGLGHMSFWGGPAYSGHPMMDDYGFGERVPRGGYQNFRHPMMGGRGFFPLGGFFFLGGLLRLIFPLAVLVAVGYFAYQKGKKDGMVEASAISPPVESPEDGK
jgi:hypothetical protein